MPMLEDILFAIRHPLQSAGGTTSEFLNTMRSAYNNAQMQRILQVPNNPIGQAPLSTTGITPLISPIGKQKKSKKVFTPEEELKQTTQAGQLAVLNQPIMTLKGD